MDKNDDWRLTYQESYLKGKALTFKQYEPPSPTWDHDHCAFCWHKFSESESDLHEGYYIPENKHWICRECFNDFKESFNWTIIELDL